MHLSEVECLTADYTEDEVDGVNTVMMSTLLGIPSGRIRWGGVKEEDVEPFFKKQTTATWQREFKMERITLMDNEDTLKTRHAEHLVIRDPDMKSASGIVAHASYVYYPAFPALKEITGAERASHAPQKPSEFPKGYTVELGKEMNDKIINTLCDVFQGLPCFNLEGISTLSPTYLGKGLGKLLTKWVFPYADHFGLPVTLSASPLGLHLYRKCDFEEYRQHDVIVELDKYGGEGQHRHVTMVRWPSDPEKLSPAWQEWKLKNPPTALA